MPIHELSIATAASSKSKSWKNQTTTWEDFKARIKNPTVTQETVAEYQKLTKAQRGELKDVGGFVAGSLKNGQRKRGHVAERSMVTLDADSPRTDLWEDFTLLNDCAAILYSTHSHTADAPRYRLVIPLAEPVSAEAYVPLALKLAEQLGLDNFDDTTYQPDRLMYWGSHARDGEYLYEEQEGDFLKPMDVLKLYPDWQDSSYWPETKRRMDGRAKEAKKAGDPLEKPGVIGAFNRQYSIQAAIETFLPEVYTATEHDDRYTYSEGTTAGGLVIYNDLFAYSHHATDPIGDTLVNAYDLVRIHKFGDLDDNSRETTAINNLPSSKAMAEFALKIDSIKSDLADQAIGSAVEDFEDDLELPEEVEKDNREWLSYNKQGSPVIGYNLLAQQVLKEVPVYYNDTHFLHYNKKKGIWQEGTEGYLNSYLTKKKLGEMTKRNHLGETMANIKGLAHNDEEFPEQPAGIIVLKDGTYNIKTGTFKEGFTPDLHARTCHPITYDPAADCPTFDGYLKEVVGEEEARVIYEWMGYLFYGNYQLQKMLFLYGGGGTGKSTLLNLMQELVGKEAISAITLEAMMKEPHAMAGLVSKTANFDADAKPEFLKDGALLKKLTGDDMSYANPKNRDAFYFRNKAKLTFSMNTLPPMSDHSGGLARRAMIIKMDKRVTQEVMDTYPLKTMKQEQTGIFNKAMDALREALKRGDFTETEAMKEELAKWLEGNDTVALFIKDGCIQDNNMYEITSNLYRDYSIYARESGFKPISKLRFYSRVIDLGFEKKTKKQGATTVQAFIGLQSTGTEF